MIELLAIVALTGCLPEGTEVVCHFPAPWNLTRREIRLQVACQGDVRLNGSLVEGRIGPREMSDLLIGRGQNVLRMGAGCSPARLLVTPRVYIAEVLAVNSGLSVTVKNALDNTVSVGLSCRGTEDSGSASSTIAANGQVHVPISVRAKGKVTCILDKEPEALEESYRYQMDVAFQ